MKTLEAEVSLAVSALRSGKTILYPTDSIWGIGCDPTNTKEINRVYEIKKRADKKNLIILVDTTERLKEYVSGLPDVAFDLIHAADKPLTIVYSGARNLAKNLLAPDKSIAIRLTNDPFCRLMIKEFGKAVVSTSANISGEASPLTFGQISDHIKQSVDHIVGINHQQIRQPKASTIIRLEGNGGFTIIRP
jgi:L-threonylcarbamoyladenylate synthase